MATLVAPCIGRMLHTITFILPVPYVFVLGNDSTSNASCTRPHLFALLAALQVSDREWLATQPDTAARLAKAQEMVAAGRGEEVCFRADDIDGAAITARRWASLAGVGGDDDMFSSDLSDQQCQVRGPHWGGIFAG